MFLIIMLMNQPILNIGCLGSVSHGKSTMVKLLTGKTTQQHSKEKIRNITMKVGYANCKFYQDESGLNTDGKGKMVHHFSFVDCPGHHELIEVMMTGASLMDYGIVVVAGNQNINDQPQLKQHLLTAKMIGIKKLIFVLNKLDLVTKTLAIERKYELLDFLKSEGFNKPLIIPVSLNLGLNKEFLMEAIYKEFPPITNTLKNKETLFSINRSFDINKVGINPITIKGGVVGGSVLKGCLKVGDEVYITPGQTKYDKVKEIWLNKPFKTKITSLKTEDEFLDEIKCGGLTAVGLEIDPYFTQNDKLKGQILHLNKNSVKVYSEMSCKILMIEKCKLNVNDIINIQIGCSSVVGKIKSIENEIYKFKLNKAVPVYKDIKVIISNKNNKMLEIIGIGELK